MLTRSKLFLQTIKSISNASSCIDYWQGGAFLCLNKKLFPAELRVLLLAGAVGVMVTAGGLAAMAALMTAQGYSGAAAPPLATAAVGAGSLCSGWMAAAFRKKARGLLSGLLQSTFLGGTACAFCCMERHSRRVCCGVPHSGGVSAAALAGCLASPCAAAGMHFVDQSGKSNTSEGETAYVDL